MPSVKDVGIIVEDDESSDDISQGSLGGRCGEDPGEDSQPALDQAEKPRSSWRKFG
jgi:hypothetical protein